MTEAKCTCPTCGKVHWRAEEELRDDGKQPVVVYDIATDEFRPILQQDVERFEKINNLCGLLVRAIRGTVGLPQTNSNVDEFIARLKKIEAATK